MVALFTRPVSAGTVGSNASAMILRIRPADVGTDGNTPNAGYYQLFIRGVVTAGYNATGWPKFLLKVAMVTANYLLKH